MFEILCVMNKAFLGQCLFCRGGGTRTRKAGKTQRFGRYPLLSRPPPHSNLLNWICVQCLKVFAAALACVLPMLKNKAAVPKNRLCPFTICKVSSVQRFSLSINTSPGKKTPPRLVKGRKPLSLPTSRPPSLGLPSRASFAGLLQGERQGAT